MNFLQKLHAAENPNTPTKTLELLASDDEHYYVRAGVALNPNTPVKILQQLATDISSIVRACAAENPNIPLEILQQLATDESHYVRYWVAENPNRTELIERLVFMTNYKQEVG